MTSRPIILRNVGLFEDFMRTPTFLAARTIHTYDNQTHILFASYYYTKILIFLHDTKQKHMLI